MSDQILEQVVSKHLRHRVPDLRTGDSVRVHQKITEGEKSRIQVFEGVVIKVTKPNTMMARVTVRKLSGGIGVEKSWLLNSPSLVKIEILRRSKVRRKFISYMRELRGKATRLKEIKFDKAELNRYADFGQAELDEIAIKEAEKLAKAEAKRAEADAKKAEAEATQAKAEADQAKPEASKDETKSSEA
ncbi:50S ribosomal protein L19 [Candidatus Saccharibacteria bacterium]|nr:50S ribosomal protein L19 [Candidatus Saccharibacteria bacterium]MCB9834773.1 50S ribosomal protein L19 [Candidatus Nomurabacteria bacterium]